MLRDGGLRDAGLRGQRGDGLLAVAAEPLEERPAGRVGEGSEKEGRGGRA